MSIRARVALLVGLTLGLAGCASLKGLPPGHALTPGERKDAIRRAAVWAKTDIPSLDLTLRAGDSHDVGPPGSVEGWLAAFKSKRAQMRRSALSALEPRR